jgi:tripartite-type tricarboxylate transporter receptor subunit TctC
VAAVKAGHVRVIALAGEKRLSIFPNVPTTAEEGSPEYTAGAPFGVYVPAGTPQSVIDKLNATLNEIVMLPDVREKLAGIGLTPLNKTQPEFVALYQSEIAKWKRVVQTANIPQIE